MKSNDKIYNLYIDIVTYKTEHKNNMNAVVNKKNNTHNKFICSICLNQKCVNDNKGVEFGKRKSKSCPICHHTCNSSIDGESTLTKETELYKNNNIGDNKVTRNVQTSQIDVHQGLSLLNEVLNAFQTKKESCDHKESRKTLIFKDVGVSTEDNRYDVDAKPKLTMSKIFRYSIEDKSGNENKFVIVSSSQPETMTVRTSLDVIKHKSSSIPQMKLEELKNSLKEKTKSKDAIEEANRIFANVKRVEKDCDDNRPLIRNGPRVLPVVKTANYENRPDFENRTENSKECCHDNYHMSSGDSCEKHKCCHINKGVEDCANCSYLLCCHCKHRCQKKEVTCERCRTTKEF